MTLAVAAAVATIAGGAQASGFALIEQNASGLGNAYAGAAAAAEDASTIYFNPAGMTRLPGRQAVGALHAIIPSAKFNNTGSTPAGGGFSLGGEGGDAGDLALVPNAYLSWQLNPQWFVGVGLNAPFGLKTDYDADWMGRFHALKSEAKSININPSVAFKVNDMLSLGFGLNWQRFEATLTKTVNYTAVGAGLLIPVAASTAGSNDIEGDDSAWGFNLGVLIKAGPNTDVGLAYRSAIDYTLSGNVTFFGRPAALNVPAAFNQVGDSSITADLKVPASFSVAIKHQVTPKWDVLADATWTEWSSLQDLIIVRSNGAVLESTPFKWDDTWRVGLGVNYRHDSAWTIRGGVAFDQTPTSDTYRTPRIPDQDRTWVSIGVQYKVQKSGAVDIGYAHLFVKDASINLSGPPAITAAQAAGRGSLVGNSENKVDIFSIQYRHSF